MRLTPVRNFADGTKFTKKETQRCISWEGLLQPEAAVYEGGRKAREMEEGQKNPRLE